MSPAPLASTVPLKAYLLGALGVLIFGLTLPMTRIAVLELDPLFVTIGRALIAALCAGLLIGWQRLRPPPREVWGTLFVFGICVVLGYPLLVGFAMQHAPSSHGGVVLAVQPLITALASMWVAGERPSPAFWICSVAGTAVAFTYALISGAGETSLHWADLLLAVAAVLGSCGYAMGGHLSRRMTGSHVIAWALVAVTPVILILLAASHIAAGLPPLTHVTWPAWGAFIYVGVFSMFLGFFPWNKALAMGGIAKVGQIQLLQPFVTLTAAWLLLGERIGWLEVIFSALVVAIVATGSRMRVTRRT